MARAVRWDLIADARKYRQGFREAETTTKRFSGMVTKTAGLIGGAFAAVQVSGFLKDAITEAREAAKVTRQTNAVIKATGGVAGVTAKDVDRLAEALSNKVGVDDEAIAAGQNMLLTFKGVRNEAGKNNDIFNQATKVALDMTAAMNQGVVTQSNLEQSNIRLGKALNDPIAGISALTRVGVTFTDAQKDQIKTLVESGDKMEAQKIILKELATEFGGAAEAAADPWQKMGVAFDNIKEDIGTVLLPAFEDAATFITETLIPAGKRWWNDHAPEIRDSFKSIQGAVESVVTWFNDELIPAIGNIAVEYDKTLKPAIEDVTKAWNDNKEAISGLNVEGEDSLTTWGKVALFFGTVMAKQVERLTTLVGLLARAWDAAKNVIIDANKWIATTFISAIKSIVGAAATVAEKLHLPFAEGLRAAEKSLDNFKDDFNAHMDGLKNEDVDVKVKGVWVPPAGSGLSVHDIVGSLQPLPRRARGGPVFGAGTATSDSIPALLSDGEHVLSAREVRGMGGHGAVERVRRRARGFAQGGAVNLNLALPPASGFSRATTAALNRLTRGLGGLSFGVALSGNPSIMSFIRSVDPLPYIWGGVGPGGYDCSGLVGEVLNRHLGLASYQRRFTTSSIRAGQYGLKTGLGGVLNIGVTAGTGHMAGSYMGMGFEAESTRSGIKVGGAASPPSSFARTYHLAKGGPVDRGVLAAYAALTGRDVGGDTGALRVGGVGVFDRGGFLPPRSATLAINRTSRAEPVGIDYDRLGQAVARALQASPPVVAVRDLQAGMNHYAGRVGQARPYR